MPHRKSSVDASEYPFASHWFERNGCALHYVDEGGDAADKIVVVMCHGNPTWSYRYRHIIKKLSAQFRYIAADYPGFGFSARPAGYGYPPQEHVQWMEALLFEHLKLDRFIIVGQDWGGPISMIIATSRPDKILGCVISSTWAWKANWIGKTFSALMGSGLGQYLILKRNFFATTIIAMMLGKTASATTLKAYADPFPTPGSRKGPAVFPVQIVAVTPWRCWRGSDSSGFDPRVSVASKGYHTSRCVDGLLAQRIAPHVAINASHDTTGPDRRILGSLGYRASQIVRKRIEQFLGWSKTVGGLRKTRLRGVRRNAQLMWLAGSAYILVRISRLCPAAG